MWDDLPGLRDPDRFDAWSYRLVVHASYREAQRERRWSSQIRRIDVDPPVEGGRAHGLVHRLTLPPGAPTLTGTTRPPPMNPAVASSAHPSRGTGYSPREATAGMVRGTA
jgi:hypothetical protein